MHDDAIALRIPASKGAPRTARHGVVEALDLEGELAEHVALLVSEAVTNSVIHNESSEVVHVDAWWTDDHLRIEVCDERGGFRRAAEAAEPGQQGHGLALIGFLADRWGVHSDGHTRIWFELPASPAGARLRAA